MLCEAQQRNPKSFVIFCAPVFKRAMTLIEMGLTAVATSLVLFLLIGWMGSVRQDSQRDLCLRELSDLDKALVRYRRAEEVYPAATSGNAIHLVLNALSVHARTKPILDAFPRRLWREGEPRVLLDSWGTPLRLLVDEDKNPAVKLNGGRPIFVSAGPDRDFGDENPAAVGDNLRSDDPGPDGFRIHDTFRDAMVEEQNVGKEVHP